MTVQENAADEAGTKRELLETSYAEILDATKHQDDKIGRILTGIAFLTAAALAFANQGGIGITTRFELVDRQVPLLAYAVGTFVVGVVFTVTMLLSSLTTGLTLPGSKPPSPEVPTGKSSLIYFYSIARLSKEQWRERWDGTAAALRSDLDSGYVDETFNLAQRTNHKYTRTNEAVGVLSLTLFALGGAFVLGTVAAATERTPDGAVPWTWPARMALAAFAGAYVAMQILAARREHLLRLRTRGLGTTDADARRINEFRVYQFAAPALAAAPITAGRDVITRVAGAVVVAAAVFAIRRAVRLRAAEAIGRRPLYLVLAAVVVLTTFVPREETWRIAASMAVPALLTVRHFAENRRRSTPPTSSSASSPLRRLLTRWRRNK